jgi:predicted AAA+ superfamily ATPase
MHEIERSLKSRIHELLNIFPAVALLGPRQCGKTTLAQEIQREWSSPSVYLDLENRRDYGKLEDCVSFLEPLEDQLVVIDEVQSRPGLFPEIRGLIDRGKSRGYRSGRFLFLGSASYELLRQSGESLAGRIACLELTPFLQHEVAADGSDKLWCRGGFPDSYLAATDGFSCEWRRNFIDTYLSRDLGLFNRVGSLPAMRDLMLMIAHLHGQVLNVLQLSESHEFTRSAITGYLDLFEQTFVIRRLQPYFVNIGKRLVKRPKIYVRDTGLLHQLFDIPDELALRGHPMRGSSWEGFVIEQIIALLPEWTPYFYRTSHGVEMDLLMVKAGRKLAFEIKVAADPTLTKGFYQACEDLQPEKRFVVSKTDSVWQGAKEIIHTPVTALKELLATV